MFPISDFNFVFCSIATVVATVGYAFTRKQGTEPPSPFSPSLENMAQHPPISFSVRNKSSLQQDPAVPGASTVRRGSLKRKVPHDGFDEPTAEIGYPFNLANIYPNKRCRTPPSRTDVEVVTNNTIVQPLHTTSAPAENQAVEIVSSILDNEIPVCSAQLSPCKEADKNERQDTILADETTPAPEPPRTPSPAIVTNDVVHSEPLPPVRTTVVPTLPMGLIKPIAPMLKVGSSSIATSMGFAAFAGSMSPFASVKKSAATASQTSSAFRSSLWHIDGEGSLGSQNEPRGNALAPAAFDGDKAEEKENTMKQHEHVIDAATLSTPKTKYTHVTGEESEDVEQELKGVKLFVKRGNKPFASGMVGHLKLLSDRTTLAERLLFRREPLWKVSMNVKINATVRCTFEAEENAIRLMLKEPVVHEVFPSSPQKEESSPLELVVYAFKPGRACSKEDFREFAESLLKNARFQKAAEDAITGGVVAFST